VVSILHVEIVHKFHRDFALFMRKSTVYELILNVDFKSRFNLTVTVKFN
jgi:hypothetical protein